MGLRRTHLEGRGGEPVKIVNGLQPRYCVYADRPVRPAEAKS